MMRTTTVPAFWTEYSGRGRLPMTVRPSRRAVGRPSGEPSSVLPLGCPAVRRSEISEATWTAAVSVRLDRRLEKRARRSMGFSAGGSGTSTSPSSPTVVSTPVFSATSAATGASAFCTRRTSSTGSASSARGSTPTAVRMGTGSSSGGNSMSIPWTDGGTSIFCSWDRNPNNSSMAWTATVSRIPAYVALRLFIVSVLYRLICVGRGDVSGFQWTAGRGKCSPRYSGAVASMTLYWLRLAMFIRLTTSSIGTVRSA